MAGGVVAQSGEADAGQQAISPQRLAHFVLRTSRFEELVDWYQTVLGAPPAFKNELLAFLSYDEEHHRVAILNVPGLQPPQEGVVGVHHCAFTYAPLADLMATYDRLRDKGIRSSEARRVGNECVSAFRSRGSPYQTKK